MLKCECCGTTKNVVLGQNTIFSEYNLICEECLSKLYAQEIEPTCLEWAQQRLEALNLADEDIYGFTVEGDSVVVEYFKNKRLEKYVLVVCEDNDEAIHVLCELVQIENLKGGN